MSDAFDLLALEYAILVDEQGSFRRAAFAKQVRTSVISRRVQALEDKIGVSLFNRTSTGAQTTIAGFRLLKHARVIVAELDALRRIANLSGRGEQGRLRLGIVASIASAFSRQILDAFVQAHGAIELTHQSVM